MKKHMLHLAVTAAFALIATSAQAGFISGGIGFAGQGTPTGGADWSNNTGVSFGAGAVTTGTGTYSGITPFVTLVTFTNFAFDPTLTPSPVNPLWSFTFGGVNYSFIMNSVSIGPGRTESNLVLNGLGTLKADGYEDTDGSWNFTGSTTARNFSVASTSGAVPLPGTLALLGLGLFGAAGATRRSMKQA